jgi:hypothetical protein
MEAPMWQNATLDLAVSLPSLDSLVLRSADKALEVLGMLHASPTIRTHRPNELTVRFGVTEKRDLVSNSDLILRGLALCARGVAPTSPSASVDSKAACVAPSAVLPILSGLAD